ncbi:hypothetical protein [Bradyrhizobium uaiense]|uniref:Uncharacterized protein n=1 Tax=Bradyrhizobium uaiense TaxID=2594946 RepID=A0A6P1BGH6_9BRAD|nr:hypothetical protein [Bradyrhizobium uaiense]NEU97505.1 hypothetical protein [Bradyrhizobium uaiense]
MWIKSRFSARLGIDTARVDEIDSQPQGRHMKNSPFVAEVKERQSGEPCFVMLNTDKDIGLGSKHVMFDMPAGTGIEHAQELARLLRSSRATVRVG